MSKRKSGKSKSEPESINISFKGKQIGVILVGLLFLGSILGAGVWLVGQNAGTSGSQGSRTINTNLAGQSVPVQGAEHLAAPYTNTPYQWNTNPPTGGWHDPVPLPAGFYESGQSIPRMIHSMEHGAIIVWYKTSVSSEDKQRLVDFFNSNRRSKLIVVPYDNMEPNFAVTAWGWIDAFNEYDGARVEAFFNDHYDQGPERAPIGSHQ